MGLSAPAFAQEQPQPTDPTQTTGPATGTVERDPNQSTTNNTLAEQSSQTADGSVPEEQAIVVTGSRIARPEIESNVPVAVVGQQQLLQDAAANIADTINELPQAAIGTTRTNTNFLTSGTGISTINLRSLGTSRTLTLVNGRRFIGGFSGDSSVDVNNIPTDFVDRVEITTGGSSAVYGSDAIAGVVNFILKDRFEGFQVRAQTGITDRGDSPTYLVSATGGHSFMDGRFNVIGNFTWDRDEGLASRNRAISDQDCGADAICGPSGYSSFAPQGRFQAIGLNAAGNIVTRPVLPGGNSIFTFDRNNANALTFGFPAEFGFNRNSLRLISTPVQRKLFTALANFEVTDNVKFFVEATHARVRSDADIEPLAVSPGTTGIAYIELDNAFIPAPVTAAVNAANTDANPNNDVLAFDVRRRLNEVFDRSNSARRKTTRIAAGLKGELLDKYAFEVSYVHGRLNDYNQTEDINLTRFDAAVDAIRVGPGSTLGVDIVCRDPAARAAGCIPLNIFGAGTADPRASQYVFAEVPRSDDINNKQQVLTASISGPIFSLWAGDVSAAIGGEYRRETNREDLDELTNNGLNSGNQIPDQSGKFNVKEIFGELSIPLIKDASFTKYLGLNGAARYSDYSTVGGIFSYNVGAEWQPVNDVRFRGVFAKANRAPNIGELFSQPSQTFAAISDPCDGVTATTAGETAAACRQIPQVAAAIAANGEFAYTLADLQAIDGFVGGNRDLREETAKTKTVGVVITPSFVPGFSATIDYYDIKLKGAIATLGRQTSVRECILSGNPVFCSQVIRSPTTGFITRVNGQLINVAAQRNTGIDIGVNYSRRLNLLADDRLTFSVNYTHLINNQSQADPSSDNLESAGTFGRGFSKGSALARASYKAGRVQFSWETSYLKGGPFLDDFESTNADVQALNDIDDYVVHGAQIRFDPNERFSLFFNVDNVFDKKPQLLPGASFGTPTGLETSADFDVFGRRFLAGVRVKF